MKSKLGVGITRHLQMLMLSILHSRIKHPKMIFLDNKLAIKNVEEDRLEVEGLKK